MSVCGSGAWANRIYKGMRRAEDKSRRRLVSTFFRVCHGSAQEVVEVHGGAAHNPGL